MAALQKKAAGQSTTFFNNAVQSCPAVTAVSLHGLQENENCSHTCYMIRATGLVLRDKREEKQETLAPVCHSPECESVWAKTTKSIN